MLELVARTLPARGSGVNVATVVEAHVILTAPATAVKLAVAVKPIRVEEVVLRCRHQRTWSIPELRCLRMGLTILVTLSHRAK